VASHDPALGTCLRLAATTGGRRSQLLALRWADIDFDRSAIGYTRSPDRQPHRARAATAALRELVTSLDAAEDSSNLAAMLPRLSTYLGHREPRYTYRYLIATPELLGHAAALLEADAAARL